MSIVREFERAFNRQDVAVLVACFTPDGSYHDTFFGGHAGADNLRAMFERMFREGRDYAWTMETVVETEECAAAEWTFAYVVSDAIPRSAGRRVRFRGMSVFEKRGGPDRGLPRVLRPGRGAAPARLQPRGDGQDHPAPPARQMSECKT